MNYENTLGKELKVIRAKRGEVLFNMANRMVMSSAMLSAIETGKKPAPEDFVDRLATNYEEVANDLDKFRYLADLTKTQVKLKLDGDEKTKQLKVTFARSVNELSAEAKEELLRFFEKNRTKGAYGSTEEKQG